jgi:hypothetical protein
MTKLNKNSTSFRFSAEGMDCRVVWLLISGRYHKPNNTDVDSTSNVMVFMHLPIAWIFTGQLIITVCTINNLFFIYNYQL